MTAAPGWAADVVAEQPYPLVFATVSGAHLYGFPSADSDLDLRGVHVLPVTEVVGLRHGPETIQAGGVRHGTEVDLVTHDVAKFCRLLLRRNGYVLEQVLSPLVVHSTDTHHRLAKLARDCVTRQHAHHYLGFAATQWRLFQRTGELKPALYTLRALLTGQHLMRTGEVVADLGVLWPNHELPYVPELIAAKASAERAALTGPASDRLGGDVARLRALLESAREASSLPDRPPPAVAAGLHDLVVRLRLDAR